MFRRYIYIFYLINAMVCMPLMALAQTHEQELLSTAQQAFNDGFSDLASQYLEDFLSKYPQSPKLITAKLLLGQCYFLQSQYPQALTLFQELAALNDNKDAILFWRGEVYLKQNQFAQAQADYELVIQDFPTSAYVPQAYYSLGWLFFEQKEFNKAKSTFMALVSKFPNHQFSEDATLKVAEGDYNAGHFEDAITSFQTYIDRYPASTHLCDVNFNIAESYYYLEQYQAAVPYYQKALDASCEAPLKMGAHTGLAWSYIKLKRFTDAGVVLKAANELAKGKSLSLEELALAQANLAYEQGNYENAIRFFSDFIKDYPQSEHWTQGYLGRANIYYLLRKYDDAASDYKRILGHSDADAFQKAHFGLGWTLLKQGHLPEALSHFQTVYDKSEDPQVKINALIQMADVNQESGQLEDAVAIYTRALDQAPVDFSTDYVQYRQAIALLKLEKVDAALECFKKLKTNSPHSKYLDDFDYYMGVAGFKKGEWGLAAATIETFLKSLTRPSEFTPEANYILALSYLNLKQPDNALKVFQKILRLYPNDINVAKNADIGIAKCLFELGQGKEAVKRFKMIVFKYPKTEVSFEGLLWLAQYYLKNGDAALASDYYKAIVQQFSDHPQINQIHYELGQAYEIVGQSDQALDQYKSITASKDVHLMAKTQLAMAGILAKDLNPQRAVAAYESIISAHPDYASVAYVKLGQLYRNAQDFEKEIDVYQKALKSKDDALNRAQLQFSLADTLELMSRTEEAIDQYLRIPRLYPQELVWVVKAYLRVAKIFEESKDWQGARVTYQKIIQLNTEEARYAQERLEWIKKNSKM